MPDLVTRSSLRAAGFTDAEVRTRLSHRGDLHTVSRGYYVDRIAWADASREQRHRWEAAAALTASGPRCVASHGSAAVLHQMPVLRRCIQVVHLTRRDGKGEQASICPSPSLGTTRRR